MALGSRVGVLSDGALSAGRIGVPDDFIRRPVVVAAVLHAFLEASEIFFDLLLGVREDLRDDLGYAAGRRLVIEGH